MTPRIYNFGAGPSMFPETVLHEAQGDLLNWNQQGVSILEIGARTPEFMGLMESAERSFRELLSIPDNYHVLFLGGAARMQFSMIPMNFLRSGEQAGYLVSGIWSQLAYQEAKHLKQAYNVWAHEPQDVHVIPDLKKLDIKDNTRYIYYTPNETINGTRFPYVPKTGSIPLVADMTSCLLSEPIDVRQYGLIFAGAQKNIANAGLTIVIIRDDMLVNAPNPPIPTMFHYETLAQHRSLFATPPMFNCYLASKMCDWIKEQGGVEALFKQNCLKAAALYQYLDSSAFYTTTVAKEARSLVNVCFSLPSPALEEQFVTRAEARGLYALKGHRSVGGIRASMYNAMPLSGVHALIQFMAEFEEEYRV